MKYFIPGLQIELHDPVSFANTKEKFLKEKGVDNLCKASGQSFFMTDTTVGHRIKQGLPLDDEHAKEFVEDETRRIKKSDLIWDDRLGFTREAYGDLGDDDKLTLLRLRAVNFNHGTLLTRHLNDNAFDYNKNDPRFWEWQFAISGEHLKPEQKPPFTVAMIEMNNKLHAAWYIHVVQLAYPKQPITKEVKICFLKSLDLTVTLDELNEYEKMLHYSKQIRDQFKVIREALCTNGEKENLDQAEVDLFSLLCSEDDLGKKTMKRFYGWSIAYIESFMGQNDNYRKLQAQKFFSKEEIAHNEHIAHITVAEVAIKFKKYIKEGDLLKYTRTPNELMAIAQFKKTCLELLATDRLAIEIQKQKLSVISSQHRQEKSPRVEESTTMDKEKEYNAELKKACRLCNPALNDSARIILKAITNFLLIISVIGLAANAINKERTGNWFFFNKKLYPGGKSNSSKHLNHAGTATSH